MSRAPARLQPAAAAGHIRPTTPRSAHEHDRRRRTAAPRTTASTSGAETAHEQRPRLVRIAAAGSPRPRASPPAAARGSRATPAEARRARSRSMPTSSETTIVRVSSTVPLSGRSAPKDLNSWSSAGASAMPPSRPSDAPADAQQEAFEDDRAHDLPARGAERAQQAELARALGDGDREGVEDDERPDDQRDVGEDEQEGAQEAQVAFQFGGLRRRLLRRPCALRRARQRPPARGRAARPASRPAAAATSIWSKRPSSPATRWASASVSSAAAAPPKDWLPANFVMPTIV